MAVLICLSYTCLYIMCITVFIVIVNRNFLTIICPNILFVPRWENLNPHGMGIFLPHCFNNGILIVVAVVLLCK